MDSEKIPLTDLRLKSTSPWKPTSQSGIELIETEPSNWGTEDLHIHIPGTNNSSPTIHQPLLTNVRKVKVNTVEDKNAYTPSLPDTDSMPEASYNEDCDLEPYKHDIPGVPVYDEPNSKNSTSLEDYNNDQNKTRSKMPRSELTTESNTTGAVVLYGSETETKMPSHVRFNSRAAGLIKTTESDKATEISKIENNKSRSEANKTHDSVKGVSKSRMSPELLTIETQKSSHPRTVKTVPLKKPKIQRSASYNLEIQRKKNITFGEPDDNTDGAGCCGWLLYIFSILIIIVTLPFSLIFCIKVVQEYERAVIFRLGRLPSGGAKGPGIFFIIPCIESYTKIDLRTVSFDVPPQEVLTKDSVTVSVDAVVYYRVSNPTVSVANVENAHHSTRLLAQTTLRNILGTKNMSEILSDRESISQGMQSTLDDATDRWGIKVERVEIKDVRLPVQLQRAMAAEAEAAREARAKVIAAEGEQKASRALKEAADVMSNSSAALQLRYLQTLSSISSEKNSTIVFPLPIDILKCFMEKK